MDRRRGGGWLAALATPLPVTGSAASRGGIDKRQHAMTDNGTADRAPRVTLGLLMEERAQEKQLYVPVPGTRYEVAPKVWVTLKHPTRGLSTRFFKEYQEYNQTTEEGEKEGERIRVVFDYDRFREDHPDTPGPDLYFAQMVTEGKWPEDPGDLLESVVGAIFTDFIDASMPITREETALSKALQASLEILSSSSPG